MARMEQAGGSAGGGQAAISHPGIAEYGLLLLLSLVWGSSFIAIKVAVANAMPPTTLVMLRMVVSTAMLCGLAVAKGQAWPRLDRDGWRLWLRIAFLGVVGSALPYFLISWGELFTSSQLAGILMATIPLFVVILAHFMTHDEKLSWGKLIGVCLGFLGVVILVGVDALRGLGSQVIGQLAILLGCFCYSFYGINTRRLPKMGSEMTVGSILLAGTVLMLPVWLWHDRPWELDWPGLWRSNALAAALWLGFASTGCGNLLFFVILRRAGAGFSSFNNYLVPLIALVYGYFWLGEQPGLNAVAALLLVLMGLAAPRLFGRRA